MLFLYSLLLALGVAALLPRFLFDALRHGKYAAGLTERAGSLSKLDAQDRPVLWLHCVSVGETQAARPLVRALLESHPSHLLVVSTTTLTGQRVARDAFGRTAALIFYFPFDWAWSVRRALRAVNPSAVLIMETELWPRFLSECRVRGVPVALVNGRISKKSFGRYRRIRFFIKRAVRDLSMAVMQTEADAARIREMGLAPERVRVSGNVKFDAEPDDTASALAGELRERFDFDGDRPLIVAASTHAPEERILMEAYEHLLAAKLPRRPRLLIAPRHPERFGEVAALVEASGLSWARRSSPPSRADRSCNVILLDTIGELRAAYELAELVFVGGSIAPTGGHNVLEPAAAAKCVVTGSHVFNFTSVVRTLLERDAIVQLPPLEESGAAQALAQLLQELLWDDDRRRRVGANARLALEENRGATARTVEMLSPMLKGVGALALVVPDGERTQTINL